MIVRSGFTYTFFHVVLDLSWGERDRIFLLFTSLSEHTRNDLHLFVNFLPSRVTETIWTSTPKQLHRLMKVDVSMFVFNVLGVGLSGRLWTIKLHSTFGSPNLRIHWWCQKHWFCDSNKTKMVRLDKVCLKSQ